ncbi:hypothetical protein FNV43_RR18093 [Rhamnella rubrinervis]|uniref:Protein TILLER ANGLE CONTROL 1 n=1 Tax=Rhamnella rubrinervis TaxID=2594499 RepID=A0A8K0E5K6_9ROSA|nr:hypothetical protein FNV43_RR18093 [Rhamnella rubrinervis]
MQIFNWVHKRFHHSVLKDEFAQNVEKTDQAPASDKDTQALLKQAALVDVLDGWKDGILTIGTFGFDPLKSFNQQKEYLVLESEEDDEESQQFSFDSNYEDEDMTDNAEDEEVNPLMFTTLGHSFDDVGSNFDANVMEKPDHDMLLSLDGVPLAPFVGSDQELGTQQEIFEIDQKKKKGERTTLADLFLADADVKMKLDSGKDLPADSPKKLNVRSKNSLSFAKKFIPRVKEDSSPIKNLQQLMKRMLKRKIHPELDDKIHKSDGQKPEAGAIGLMTTNGGQAAASNEAVSLLPIQGATSKV